MNNVLFVKIYDRDTLALSHNYNKKLRTKNAIVHFDMRVECGDRLSWQVTKKGDDARLCSDGRVR